jgi:hypothetical protein
VRLSIEPTPYGALVMVSGAPRVDGRHTLRRQIVERIVVRLGGHVTWASRTAEGSAAAMLLPGGTAARHASRSSERPTAPWAPRESLARIRACRVIALESDAGVAEMIKTGLSMVSIDVTLVASVPDLLARAGESFDVAMIEISSDGLDPDIGLALARGVREAGLARRLVLVSDATVDLVAKGIVVLKKPFDLAELVRAVAPGRLDQLPAERGADRS